MRSARIVLLKATHAPFLALILIYERASGRWHNEMDRWRSGASGSQALGLPRRHGRSETLLDDPAQDRRASGRDEGASTGAPASHQQQGEDRNQIAELARIVEKLSGQIHGLQKKLDARA